MHHVLIAALLTRTFAVADPSHLRRAVELADLTPVDGAAAVGAHEEEETPQCRALELKGFIGRLGNRVTQIVNALGVAEKIGGADFKIGAQRISPDSTLRMLFDFDTEKNITFHVKPNDKGAKECRVSEWNGLADREDAPLSKLAAKDGAKAAGAASAKAWACRPNAFWQLRCQYGFEHRTRLVQEYMRPLLNKGIAQCARDFEKKENETLVVHLRGGDTWDFRYDRHPCHAQPLCKVYDDVIERSKIPFKKILVVTDGGNDCAEHLFRKYGDRKDIKVKYTSTDGNFPDDACALLGARHVVWARSGFSALFMMLNPYREQVFLPLAHRGEYDGDADYCDVWNLNHGICPYVKDAFFYYPQEWNGKSHNMDTFGGTCQGNELGAEPVRRKK